ncbi:relaxase/mobilization nuclease domain-containing protein [Niallia sp. MER 6]|uniref:relaxase/mobilization nuclease domain-containing protein n=1 Tax=Niallia sp. MER 6 TaxID=2939567 RepID=UPI00203E0EB8|nr:hypothetical protein [Niallia sp. MER 6]MCM3032874.1 hypothetical protein [Niallia sp. MER 6]
MSFRGRAFVKVKTLRDSGMHMAKGTAGATRKVLSHLKYIGFRSRELDFDRDTKGLFDEKSDQASLKKFYKSIENEPGLRHSSTVKIHKMIISLKQEDYETYGKDFKEIARYALKGLEERKGMKLEWVGAVHLKEGHPHVHLAIKSIGQDLTNGSNKRLYIDKEDIDFLRNEIDRYTGRDQYLERNNALENDRMDMGLLKELSNTMDRLIKEGERDTHQAKNMADRQAKRQAERDKYDRER